MNRVVFLIAAILGLSACAVQPPTPEDIAGKRFEAVPGKAVIYIVRDPFGPGLSESLVLDDGAIITTHPATYYRWEVAPGTHRIAGYAASSARLSVNAEAGQIYFVEHIVRGTVRAGVLSADLRRVKPESGKELVLRAQLL